MKPLEVLRSLSSWGGLSPDELPRMRSPIELGGVTRDHFAGWLGAIGFSKGAEIGVEQGLYAETLCKANPSLHLTCVDAWERYQGYREHVTQEKMDGFYETTKARLAPYNATIIRGWSRKVAEQVPDGSLDFVYIDANHSLLSVIEDLTAWVPKVRRGGVVAGHDWCRRKQSGYQVHVVEAVTAYVSAYHIDPYFVIGAKPIIDGVPRDRPRSFCWVVL